MMDRRGILRSVNFGHRVAEEETDILAAYFVETDQWLRLFGGSVDIVYGPKGSGKSALYSLLLANTEVLHGRRILLTPGENLRGATAFRNLATNPPATEKEAIGLWKLYILSLAQSALSDNKIQSDAATQVTNFLAREGLIKGKVSLATLLRAVGNYVARALHPNALEGGLDIDPISQLPKGFHGKITFAEPQTGAGDNEFRSVDALLRLADTALEDADLCVWIALDRLDVAFADTPELETNVLRALFRAYLDLMELRKIRLKVFLRSDIWTSLTSKGFREASHITRHLTIGWTRSSLLNLVVRRLLHNTQIQSAYDVAESVAQESVEAQERFLYRIFPDTIDVASVEATVDWLLSRLRDGTKATEPREIIHFLNCLRDVQVRKLEVGDLDLEAEQLFSRSTFRDALPEVSKVRLEQTLYAEHPDYRPWIDRLRGAKSLQTTRSLASLWSVSSEETERRCSALVDVGFFEPRGTPQAPEYWIPFLYGKALGMVERLPGAIGDLAVRLREYLTPSSPLGPSDASRIRDLEVAAKLFDAHNSGFGALLRRDLAVVVGRRGSGKTTLLNSYQYRPFLRPGDTPSLSDSRSDFAAYETVIEVTTYKHFDDMQRLVTRDATVFRPIEAIVDDWDALLTDYICARMVADELGEATRSPEIETLRAYLQQDEDEDEYRAQVRRLVWGVSLWDKIRGLMPRVARRPRHVTRDDAVAAAVEYLRGRGRRAVVILDSMDEYDISDSTFSRTLGGLMRFVAHFNTRQDRIRIKVGLPLEILPEIQRASANPLKDFVDVDHIQWTAAELAQIAAYRYRLFLELYDADGAADIAWLDLSRRDDVWEFWSRVFQDEVRNEYGVVEEPLTYVFRHTQLLPRQVLIILQKAIVIGAGNGGGYRRLNSAATKEAVDSTVPLIANEILRAFSHVYPMIEELCRPVFANCPTTLSFDELEDRWRKRGRPVARRLGETEELEIAGFVEMLSRIGIIGAVRRETDKYYEGAFAYDSATPVNLGDRQLLCLHPVFTRHFNAAGNVKRKAIIPLRANVGW